MAVHWKFGLLVIDEPIYLAARLTNRRLPITVCQFKVTVVHRKQYVDRIILSAFPSPSALRIMSSVIPSLL